MTVMMDKTPAIQFEEWFCIELSFGLLSNNREHPQPHVSANQSGGLHHTAGVKFRTLHYSTLITTSPIQVSTN
jgi:hypothetical protein